MTRHPKRLRGCDSTLDPLSDEEGDIHISAASNAMTGETKYTYVQSTLKRVCVQANSDFPPIGSSSKTELNPPEPSEATKSNKEDTAKCKQVR
jgi:hypothetical protein